jgi:hypothetical protein
MTMLHVIPDELGNWRVLEDVAADPLSKHLSATQAEAAAVAYAETYGCDAILVHDRYHRCRRLPARAGRRVPPRFALGSPTARRPAEH